MNVLELHPLAIIGREGTNNEETDVKGKNKSSDIAKLKKIMYTHTHTYTCIYMYL